MNLSNDLCNYLAFLETFQLTCEYVVGINQTENDNSVFKEQRNRNHNILWFISVNVLELVCTMK